MVAYYYYKYFNIYALAVSPGDVSAVPEPGAAWLLGVGLLGLMGLSVARRKLWRFGNSSGSPLIRERRGR